MQHIPPSLITLRLSEIIYACNLVYHIALDSEQNAPALAELKQLIAQLYSVEDAADIDRRFFRPNYLSPIVEFIRDRFIRAEITQTAPKISLDIFAEWLSGDLPRLPRSASYKDAATQYDPELSSPVPAAPLPARPEIPKLDFSAINAQRIGVAIAAEINRAKVAAAKPPAAAPKPPAATITRQLRRTLTLHPFSPKPTATRTALSSSDSETEHRPLKLAPRR